MGQTTPSLPNHDVDPLPALNAPLPDLGAKDLEGVNGQDCDTDLEGWEDREITSH